MDRSAPVSIGIQTGAWAIGTSPIASVNWWLLFVTTSRLLSLRRFERKLRDRSRKRDAVRCQADEEVRIVNGQTVNPFMPALDDRAVPRTVTSIAAEHFPVCTIISPDGECSPLA